jgi:hypothetical protein
VRPDGSIITNWSVDLAPNGTVIFNEWNQIAFVVTQVSETEVSVTLIVNGIAFPQTFNGDDAVDWLLQAVVQDDWGNAGAEFLMFTNSSGVQITKLQVFDYLLTTEEVLAAANITVDTTVPAPTSEWNFETTTQDKTIMALNNPTLGIDTSGNCDWTHDPDLKRTIFRFRGVSH